MNRAAPWRQLRGDLTGVGGKNSTIFELQSQSDSMLDLELLPRKSVLNRTPLKARISSSAHTAQMASAALITNASHSHRGCLTPSLILIRNAISTQAF